MGFTNAQIKGIIAASIFGLIIVGGFGSAAYKLKEKNVTLGETARTIGRSIMGKTNKAKSPEFQKSSSESIYSTPTIILSSDSQGGGSRRRCKKVGKRKTKGKR